ncbi:MAG: riboflavin biosynthesis protein RibF [Acidobacteriota bacterium]
MLVIENLDDLPRALSFPVLTIGVFDGVHLGHQAIFRRLTRRAIETGGTSILLTFTPHPQKIISPPDAPPQLQTDAQKQEILSQEGIDILVRLPFTRRLSLLTPDQFARDILHSHGIREIHVGSNFRFGHRRSGDFQTLRALGRKYGFEVHAIDSVRFRNRRVSSTKVRLSLREGKTSLVRRLLGRPYQIRGTVVRGDRRGVQLGFPTANLHPANELIPCSGVYFTYALVNGKRLPSVTNVGYRPTIGKTVDGPPLVESHLIGYEGDLYGKNITVDFLMRVRPETRFSGLEELKRHIRADIQKAHRYFDHFHRLEEGRCP